MSERPLNTKKGVRFYLRQDNNIYRAFKIEQLANLDIIVTSKSGLYIPKNIVEKFEVGGTVEVEAAGLSKRVHHYTVHSKSGQRHIKETALSVATDPIIGHKIDTISTVVPLLTCVVPASESNKEIGTKGEWFGLNLPPDVNYAVIDLVATPLGSSVMVDRNLGVINNERPTQERFNQFTLEMRNCTVVVFVHTTNHLLTDLTDTIFFQQSEGKTLTITRVEKGKVLGTITNTIVNNLGEQ